MQRRKLYGFGNFVRIYIFHQVKPTIIFCDNQSCIALTQNLKFYARTKHVEIHHHFVCEKMLSGDVEIKHCNTKSNMQIFL